MERLKTWILEAVVAIVAIVAIGMYLNLYIMQRESDALVRAEQIRHEEAAGWNN